MAGKTLAETGHLHLRGDLRRLLQRRHQGGPLRGASRQRLCQTLAHRAQFLRIIAIHQQPLRARTGLLIEPADLIGQGIERMGRGGLGREIHEADAMAPIDPATTRRELLPNGLQGRFATPRGDTIGLFAQ